MPLKPDPALTRRRDPESREEAWLIFYGDVHVGTIGIDLTILPTATNGRGTAVSIRVAIPATLPTAPQPISVRRGRRSRALGRCSSRSAPEPIFLEYRRYRASDAWKRAMWDPGCKLPTQVADGRS
jgi:hypothetical protein